MELWEWGYTIVVLLIALLVVDMVSEDISNEVALYPEDIKNTTSIKCPDLKADILRDITSLTTKNQQLIIENEELQKQIEALHKQITQNRKIYGKTFDAPGDWIKANQLIVSGGIATIEGVDYLENEFHGDSMMPFIAADDTHSIVLLKRLSAQEKDKLVTGDIIIFNGHSNKLKITAEGSSRSPERIRTMHRIVEINTSAGKCFITKGDAYEDADYYCVPSVDIEGVVVGVIY